MVDPITQEDVRILLRCTGQAGTLPRLVGFSAFKRFLPLAHSLGHTITIVPQIICLR